MHLKLSCPHCQARIGIWQKMLLGPIFQTICRACGNKVTVPFTAMFAMTPAIAANVALPFIPSVTVQVASMLIAVVLMFALHLKWVPLIPR